MTSDARVSNRLKHAATLWSNYCTSASPRQLDRWLSEALRAEKRFGSQDRRFYSDVIFAAARWVTFVLFTQHIQMSVDSFLQSDPKHREKLLKEFCDSIATEELLWNRIQATSAQAVVEFAWAAQSKQSSASPEYEIVLDRLTASPQWTDDDLRLLLLMHGIPPEWTHALKRRVSVSQWSQAQTVQFLQMQNQRPPLWIRLNHLGSSEKVDADLRSHDLTVEWLENSACARVTGTFGVYQADSFKSGLFEVQDWASQQISQLVDARPGQKIWDACAGGGGKSVAIAAALAGKGALYASDIREFKLAEVRRRCQRAGFHNVRTLVWDGIEMPRFGKEVDLQAGFDCVLVDAPCTSSGTWRRNPDARLRIGSAESRMSLHTLQKDLLTRAASKVRAGGRLVYGTCSWCVEENEDVVSAALERLTGSTFQPDSGHVCGAPWMDADTMFAASVQRQR